MNSAVLSMQKNLNFITYFLKKKILQGFDFVTNRKAYTIIRYGFFQNKYYGGSQKRF